MQLKPYQHEAIEYMRERPWSILALDMRMGKSACALLSAEEALRIMIICPVISTIPWLREIQKWTPVRTLEGVQILQTLSDTVDRKAKIHIVPYSLVTHYATARLLPRPDYMIVDECHYVKNPDADRTEAVTTLMPHVPRGACLSGTPMPSRPAELWPLLSTMGVYKNRKEYERRFCQGHMTEWGWSARGAANLEELRDELATVMFRRTKADLKGQWAPVQDPTVIELDLPVDEREKAFDRREILRNPSPLAFEAVSDILHLNAMRKVPLAVEHIRNVLESEEKVVVFAWHRDVLQELELELVEYWPVTIHGGKTGTQRQTAVDFFQKDPTVRVMIANYQAAGESITLDAASYVIFVECSWVPKDIHQPVARCSGHGQKETVRVDILTIHQSVDAHVLHVVLNKEDTIATVITETKMSKAIELSKLDQAIRRLIIEGANAHDATALGYLKALIPESFRAQDEEVEEEEEAPAPKKAKVTKKKAAKKAEPEEDLDLVDPPAKKAKAKPEPEPEVEDLTEDQVRRELAQCIKVCGPHKAKELLGQLGASKLSEVTPEQYANLVEMCEEANAEVEG